MIESMVTCAIKAVLKFLGYVELDLIENEGQHIPVENGSVADLDLEKGKTDNLVSNGIG